MSLEGRSAGVRAALRTALQVAFRTAAGPYRRPAADPRGTIGRRRRGESASRSDSRAAGAAFPSPGFDAIGRTGLAAVRDGETGRLAGRRLV